MRLVDIDTFGCIMLIYAKLQRKERRMDYRKLLALPVLAVMASCAATNPTNTVVSDTVKSNVEQTKMLELTDEGKVPNWYVNIPEPGDEVMFVAGSGTSRDLTLAKDKGILDAEKQLANQIDALVSSRFKQYQREVGSENQPVIVTDNEQVVKKLVVEAQVAGYHIAKSTVVPEKQGYRWFVLLAYPVGEANALWQIKQTEKAARLFKGDKTKAFKELDSEIDAKRLDQDQVTNGQAEQFEKKLEQNLQQDSKADTSSDTDVNITIQPGPIAEAAPVPEVKKAQPNLWITE